MKAWLLNGYQGIESLVLQEVPDRAAAPGEVVLRMEYAGLNPADNYLAQRMYPARPTFPHVLGREGLGRVMAVGEGVTGWQVGEPAVILPSSIGADRWGTLAEQVAVPAEFLAHPVPSWPTEVAAAATLTYLTAWQALIQWGDLPPGTVLVTGASGGVGSAAVQLAAALGHRVVALTRSDAKAAALRELGAAIITNITQPDWKKQLLRDLGEKRVDLAVDNIGGELLPEVMDLLAMNGRVSLVGRLAGPVPQFNTATMFFRRLRMGGVAVTAWNALELAGHWECVTELLQSRHCLPRVDQVFEMDQLPAAFARLAAGPVGKVLVSVASAG